MRRVKLKNGTAQVHTGGACCEDCAAGEARFDAWYAKEYPEQASRSRGWSAK